MPCLAHSLSIAGGVFEICGLVLVVAEISKVQRHEFPERQGRIRRSLAGLRQRLKRRRPHMTTVVHAGGATASGSGGVTAVIGVPGPPPTLEQRIERLEEDFKAAAEAAVQDRDEMRKLAREARRRTDAVARELRELVQELEQGRRDSLKDTLFLQKLGTSAFIVGVVLSVAGNLVPC